MTFDDFQGQVASRRSITGEKYSDAAKKVLEYLKSSGRLSESEAREFERRMKSGH